MAKNSPLRALDALEGTGLKLCATHWQMLFGMAVMGCSNQQIRSAAIELVAKNP